jgi:hypothetical protein
VLLVEAHSVFDRKINIASRSEMLLHAGSEDLRGGFSGHWSGWGRRGFLLIKGGVEVDLPPSLSGERFDEREFMAVRISSKKISPTKQTKNNDERPTILTCIVERTILEALWSLFTAVCETVKSSGKSSRKKTPRTQQLVSPTKRKLPLSTSPPWKRHHVSCHYPHHYFPSPSNNQRQPAEFPLLANHHQKSPHHAT